jgi:hypothetical protein
MNLPQPDSGPDSYINSPYCTLYFTTTVGQSIKLLHWVRQKIVIRYCVFCRFFSVFLQYIKTSPEADRTPKYYKSKIKKEVLNNWSNVFAIFNELGCSVDINLLLHCKPCDAHEVFIIRLAVQVLALWSGSTWNANISQTLSQVRHTWGLWANLFSKMTLWEQFTVWPPWTTIHLYLQNRPLIIRYWGQTDMTALLSWSDAIWESPYLVDNLKRVFL